MLIIMTCYLKKRYLVIRQNLIAMNLENIPCEGGGLYGIIQEELFRKEDIKMIG